MPEGQYTQASRRSPVKDVTDAVVRADGGKFNKRLVLGRRVPSTERRDVWKFDNHNTFWGLITAFGHFEVVASY